MRFETKFLYIGKIFLLIYFIINAANFIPFKLLDIFYYTNIINIILDTSTLLLLGLAIPRFLIIRKVKLLKNLVKLKNGENNDQTKNEIDNYIKKENINTKLNFYCSVFFSILLIIQPINMLFILNKNDVITNSMIYSMDQNLNNQRSQLLKLKEKNKITDSELNKEKMVDYSNEIDKNLDILESNYKINLEILLKNNNLKLFNRIKFLLRNSLLALVWAIAFFKLSKIRSNTV